MYLHELKIWNFRKYGINGDDFATAEPGVTIEFQDGVNVLIGENNSGKTTIIDAIRLVLKTQSQDFFQVEEKDFFQNKGSEYRATELKIECTFKGFSHHDAAHFLEWIGFDNKECEDEQKEQEYILKVWLYAKRKDNSVIQYTRAGLDSDGTYLEGEAKEVLKIVYLKPLRDALAEMTHGNKSRLAQILKSHPIFISKNDETGTKEKHKLEKKYKKLKDEVDVFFQDGKEDGSIITQTLKRFLEEFLLKSDKKDAAIQLTGTELTDILKQLDLVLEENKSGLGSLNLLFIAAELLLHQEHKQGLKLTLIEELEAHLHPQYQHRLIDFITKQNKEYGQFILTTHSTTLASQIRLENLIVCQGENVFPMRKGRTELNENDYKFLERFLDTTKANLFFARGVILVEGESENLLIPTIAKIINRPLNEYGVSIVNVGSREYHRYAKIFCRKESPYFNIKVAIVSDIDVPIIEHYQISKKDLPKVVVADIAFIEDLKKITNAITFDNYPTVFESKEEFKRYIGKRKELAGLTNFPKGEQTQKQLEELYENTLKDIDTNIIDVIRTKRIEIEKSKWSNPIEIFLSKKWTLEFEIGASSLYKLLIQAEKLALWEKEELVTIETYQAIENSVELEFSNQDILLQEITVYNEAFKNIAAGKVSKVAVAQYLSEILLKQDKDIIAEKIATDPNLKYIVDAIYHVTEPPKSIIS